MTYQSSETIQLVRCIATGEVIELKKVREGFVDFLWSEASHDVMLKLGWHPIDASDYLGDLPEQKKDLKEFVRLAKYSDYYKDCAGQEVEDVFVMESNRNKRRMFLVIIDENHFLEFARNPDGKKTLSTFEGRPKVPTPEEIAFARLGTL